MSPTLWKKLVPESPARKMCERKYEVATATNI